MKVPLDMEKIAEGLGAEPRGKVAAGGGYFGAMQLAAEVQARFRVPAGGGRATDPMWTERRQVAVTPETLTRLETLAAAVRQAAHVNVGPLQLAALLLEHAAERASVDDAKELVQGDEPSPSSAESSGG